MADGWLHARHTTLGADNGLGVAAALAILEDDSLTHGPLEALFTLEEESSMGGALNLAEGWLEGQVLLNLDSEDRGEVFIGCAGGADVVVEAALPTAPLAEDEVALRLSLTGLVGGHSGIDIHRGRGNANRLLVRVLRSLEAFDARLVDYHGGTLRNALPARRSPPWCCLPTRRPRPASGSPPCSRSCAVSWPASMTACP